MISPGSKEREIPTKRPITLMAVGDVSPNREDPPSLFRYCRETLRGADIVFGQLEAPISDRGTPQFVPSAPARVPAKNVTALTGEGGGFHVMSFAGNHALDYGAEAFFDTIDLVTKQGIALVGAGKNIAEARKPAIVEREGTRVGFLAYCSVLPLGFEAEENLPGCAPLRASHHYHQWNYQPGTPPLIVTQLLPQYRQAMEQDIQRLRREVDVLVVSIHAGIFSIPAMIAMYQKEAAHAAVDAGADLVVQHHSHILKGIEVYKGKAIFYSLGNFAEEHSKPDPNRPPGRDKEFIKAPEFYRIKSQPGYEKHRFHPDALKTLIVKAYIQEGQISKVTYIPAYINRDLEPEVVSREDPRAQEVFDYVVQISDAEDLQVNYSWDGDEVVVSA